MSRGVTAPRIRLWPLVLAGSGLLGGCFSIPHPFEGPPSGEAARLLEPPPARLAVPPPANALLSDADAHVFANDMAEALLGHEVPAEAINAKSGDWQLVMSAEMEGGQVTPRYTIENPQGVRVASAEGLPEPAAAWARGDAGVLQSAAQDAAPRLADLLTSIDAAQKQNDPHSLYHRTPEVAVLAVTGAPGDGDTALARQMRLQLPQLGLIVRDDPKGVDFTVGCAVHVATSTAGNQRVELQWQMQDAAGHDLGRIVQINEVPEGTLDHAWGDVAIVVAQQAALGVREVLEKQTHPPPGTPPPSVTPSPPPAKAPPP